jgi:hypothetical protein
VTKLRNREVLIAITFREFNDDYNSKIQEKCIESIAKQSYGNFKLVVTTFGERSPKSIIEKYTDKYIIFEEVKNKSYFFQTIQNCINLSKKSKNIILWTNADNIFDNNFFYEIVKNFMPGQAGTSYPNFHYYNLDDYYEKKPNNNFDYKSLTARPLLEKRKYVKSFFSYDPNLFIADAQYIDADVLLTDKSLYKEVLPLEFLPGISVFLTFSALASSHINLIFKSKIHIIENSRALRAKTREKNNDLEEYKASVIESKSERFKKYDKAFEKVFTFAEKNGVNSKYMKSSILCSRKFYMHSRFIPIGNLVQKSYYYVYKLYWFLFPKKKFKLIWLYESSIQALKKMTRKYINLKK